MDRLINPGQHDLYLADCLDSRVTQLIETGLNHMVASPYGCQGRLKAAHQHLVLLACLQKRNTDQMRCKTEKVQLPAFGSCLESALTPGVIKKKMNNMDFTPDGTQPPTLEILLLRSFFRV